MKERLVHFLQFERPIRLGLWITDAIGPFETEQAALLYYDTQITQWKLDPGTVTSKCMVTPEVSS